MFGLIVAVAMGAFSTYIFFKTSDWVAGVFFLGSVAYVAVFATIRNANRQSGL